ncbi:MAG: HNH endonuclease signature motif containing protein [Candidatus Nanopelagicales bacterium]
MTNKLDDATLGSHHRVAPHLTVVVDTTDASAPLIGRMAVPGQDGDVLLGEESVNRLLCDADVTRVLTTTAATAATADPAAETDESTTVEDDTANAYLAAVVTTLEAMARSVLYVGRRERTISARLRRALEIRDGHCVFPGCRARVARCHAHHVQHWKNDGPTDLPNLALLCVTHHVAVHEGGWTLALKPGATGHERGCWRFTPPPPKTRTRRP